MMIFDQEPFHLRITRDFLNDLEKTSSRLLRLLEIKAKCQGIEMTAISAVFSGALPETNDFNWREIYRSAVKEGNPKLLPAPLPIFARETLESWRDALKQLMSYLPDARRLQKRRSQHARTHLRLWQTVELLEFYFVEHGLAIKGKGSKFETCPCVILQEAGLHMKEDAVHRLVWSSRRRNLSVKRD